MARIVKEDEYNVRRNEILESANRFVFSKGYEQMAIQDILDNLHISKGAFYHYFTSKQALLEAMIERYIQDAQQVLLPIVHDPDLPALEKFQRFFDTIARWKTSRKEYIIALLRGWYSDSNAIVRQKINTAGVKWYAPMMTEIICQGIREGVMDNPHPEQTGEVILALSLGLGEGMIGFFLPDGLHPKDLPKIEAMLAAYGFALERILGIPAGSIQFADMAMMQEWIILEATPAPQTSTP
jgi:AcrR family transcriptional regulator